MNAVLICPGKRPALNAVGDILPLALLPVMGRTLLEYWLDYLFDHGVRQVFLVVTDGAEQVRAWLAQGTQWEMRIDLVEKEREPTAAEARAEYHKNGDTGWLPEPGDVSVLNCLPGAPEYPLFEGYAGLFEAFKHWLPRAATAPDRIGLHKIEPEIWVGLRSHFSKDVVIESPCWIGEDVFIGSGAIVGPGAILEDGVVISAGARVADSFVGPHTRVGDFTEITRSLVFGNCLINWHTGSAIKVEEEFLLCDIQAPFPTGYVGQLFGGAMAANGLRLKKLSSFCNSLRRPSRLDERGFSISRTLRSPNSPGVP